MARLARVVAVGEPHHLTQRANNPGQSFTITGVLNAEVIQQLRHIAGLETKHLMKALLDAPGRRPNGQLVLVVTPEVMPSQAD